MAVILLLLLAAGCGSSSGESADRSDSSEESEVSEDRSDERSEASDDESDASEATDSEVTGPAANGELFTGPNDDYQLRVDPAWVEISPIEGIKAWQVAEPADGFTPNVNIVTENLPTSGFDVDEYGTEALKALETMLPGFELVEQDVVDGPDGELGVIDYTANQQGRDLHLLAIFGVRGRSAVVSTLTSPPDRFEAIRAAVEPFMLSLEVG
jgi:hypothetical protein